MSPFKLQTCPNGCDTLSLDVNDTAMFEKTLTDVVKGIRASKRDTPLYISQCIAEIKTEINSSDMYVKANALQKLTFLQMMGYGMSWASFASIELMSSSRFAHKRIAYLAASQGFTQDTEVILLTTNLLKKELRGGVYEAGLAINCISNIVTEDLARDLLPELSNLTSHPQPYLRKKAILCLLKTFVKYPQGLRLTFDKIQQCLDDPNPSVVSCAVNVITELSDKNPKNYLHLAPSFFQLLTTSSNNWMLIKVVKLLGSLVPEEPRLARKLLEPLADIVRNTKAKSLLYEAVHTITLCLPYCRKNDGNMPAVVPEIVTLCAETLQSFVNETDQNLKYLGLVGFGSLMQSHPRVLSAPGYRPIILACLSDQDVTIRARALGLLRGMASRKNLIELVTQLLKHVELATGSYKLDLVSKIVEMCSGEKYALLQDFSWYLSVLFQLSHTRGLDAHSELLRSQLTDVALRVLPVRAYAVRRCIEILLEGEGKPSVDAYGDNGRGRHIMPEILPGIAWIVGEYSDLIRQSLSMEEDDEEDEEFFLDDNSKGTYHSIVQALTTTSNHQKLSTFTQKIYIQAAMKVFAAATADSRVSDSELDACVESLREDLPLFMASTDVEVQERAYTSFELLRSLGLISSSSEAPALRSIRSESSDDSDSDNGSEKPARDAPDGDLLGMASGTTIRDRKPQVSGSTAPIKVVGVSESNIASACRNAASSLNYALKPSPMKPIGAKAQRKKGLTPTGISPEEIEAEDISVFSVLYEDEIPALAGAKYSMDSVDFTQQTSVNPVEKVAPTLNGVSSIGELYAGSDGMMTIGNGGVTASFQRSNMPDSFEAFGSIPRSNQGDPFYLDSRPSTNAESEHDPSRFGMIQLSDSEDDDVGHSGNTKGKPKKEKKKRKGKQHQPVPFFSTENSNETGVAVYESDEDDIESFQAEGRPHGRMRKKNPGREFAGLAKVDLTAPLREDEVMPERKHRVVPEKTIDGNVPSKEKNSKKTKKQKKDSKKKRKGKSSLDQQSQQTSSVGDLLELGGGFSHPTILETSNSAAPTSTSFTQQTDANAISDAFEDLLGLQPTPAAPHIAPDGGAFSSLAASSRPTSKLKSPGKKRPWMRASLKVSSAVGTPSVNWSQVSLQVRVYRTSQIQGTAAMLVFRVLNEGPALLEDVALNLKEWSSFSVGNVVSGSSVETDKVGPFSYPSVDTVFDLKGSLLSAGSSIPVKISMPMTIHLNPLEGLTLEDVSNELSSPTIASHSIKIELAPGQSLESVNLPLCNFLKAAEVDKGAGGSTNTATLAAQSMGGAKAFFLLKVKGTNLKVDLKCTHPKVGKEIASDLKRLIL